MTATTMPATPPASVLADLQNLRVALDASVPAKVLDHNLVIGTWNIRAFGDLTEKWMSQEVDSPKRDLASLLCIGEILRRFDVVAVQEVRGNLKALRHVMKMLGPAWGMILTDVTRGHQGNDERLAFLFDTRRVKPSGLACELVLPEDGHDLDGSGLRQFARTPYAVSFTAGEETFILVTLHVRYGDGPEDRVAELTAIAQWLADWAHREHEWGHNLLALGDFNIDRRGDPLHQAFTSTGLTAPDALNATPRTIFDGSDAGHFYDQIAWFTGSNDVPALSLEFTGAAGGVDFVPHLMTSLTRSELSWRISDHYPLWAEFATH
jgi:endonuclease/exonuclease/phosphatase family metal-dependent hydrolase